MSQEQQQKLEKITGSSPEAKSLDITTQNIEQLKQLFPEVFSEGKIDFEALRAVLGEEIDDSEERYNFTWNGKAKARQIAQTPSTGTLRPCKEESVNWDTTENLFIEGDNLEVLKLLQKSYHKKVKMIYIDPPYNTGRDFVYKDNFHDNLKNYLEVSGQLDGEGNRISTNSDASGRYHSDWLSMMYPRLKLARNLLKDDGVIFISIDDHEYNNLRKLCDEVFGEANFIATSIWHKVYVPKNSARHFSEDHDYVLVYAKNADLWVPELLPRTEEQNSKYKNPNNDPRGPWRAGPLAARNYYSKGTYSITCPSGRIIEGPPKGLYWKYSEDKFKELDKEGRIYWGEDGNNSPAPKLYLSEVKQGRVPQTIWHYKEVGHTQDAKRELLKLVEFNNSGSVFETPKPTKLIEHVLKLSTRPKDGDIVLDFFAGSATTAQAVYSMNAKDSGNRRFILVQIPELLKESNYNNVCEISKTRIRNAASMISQEYSESEIDLGCKVFALDETNISPWDADFDNLEQVLQQATKSIKVGRSSEDVLYEIFLKYGYDLTTPVETETVNGNTVFVIGAGALIVCLDDEITTETVEGIAKLKDELDPETTQVVFKDEGFADDRVKTNAIQILKQAGIDDVKSI
ncbi:TPA: site-specific DNA-methyltransferase [Vibrio parahaemolyticus]|uniref:site-specific DNA-methyltransferase n=1 Tax=Vibrio parahaemolyticus TaxID=670 RepID=UPI001B81C30E|nr:site-specific DNA-methyltransferase [Vibrio parahaemolyticus]MEA5299003.1 site-specific DNA-methyltransferase [Vibrio parahaemolyticus]HBC3440381.1 site-specific DNA-methyltransferase [Vibrio parahaemolyticus]